MLAFLAPCGLFSVSALLCSHFCGCGTEYHWLSSRYAVRILVQAFFGIALAFVGVQRLRGRRVPLSLCGLFALAPLGLGLREIAGHERAMAAALTNATPGPRELVTMTVAESVVDQAMDFEIAAFCAGAAMLAVALAATLELSAIDTMRLGPPSPETAFRGVRWDPISVTGPSERRLRRRTMAVGLVAVVATVVARAMLQTRLCWFDALALVLAAVPVAAMTGRPVPAFRAHGSKDAADVVSRVLALCAFAWAAAVLLLEAPIVGLEVRGSVAEGALLACGGSGMSAFPLLGPTVAPPDLAPRVLLLVVDTLACLLPFVPALVAGLRARLSLSGAGIAVGTLLLGSVCTILAVRDDSRLAALREPYLVAEREMARARLTLPTSHGGTVVVALPPRWIVAASGLVSLPTSPLGRTPLGDATAPAVAADGAVTVESLVHTLVARIPAQSDGTIPIQLLAAPSFRHPVERFGRLAGLFRTDLLSYDIALSSSLSGPGPYVAESDPIDEIGVLPGARSALAFVYQWRGPSSIVVLSMGPSLTLQAADGVPPRIENHHVDPRFERYGDRFLDQHRWELHKRVVVAVAPGATVADLCTVLDALGPWLRIVVTADRAPFEAALRAWEEHPENGPRPPD